MICGRLKGWRRIEGIEGLEAGFEFLEKADLATLTLERHEIQGDAVFALAMKALSKTTDEARFESHRDYIDIQFLLLQRIFTDAHEATPAASSGVSDTQCDSASCDTGRGPVHARASACGTAAPPPGGAAPAATSEPAFFLNWSRRRSRKWSAKNT